MTKANGGAVEYPESVVFTKDAILPVQLLVLRYPSSATRELRKANQIGNISNSYSSFNRRLINNSDASKLLLLVLSPSHSLTRCALSQTGTHTWRPSATHTRGKYSGRTGTTGTDSVSLFSPAHVQRNSDTAF